MTKVEKRLNTAAAIFASKAYNCLRSNVAMEIKLNKLGEIDIEARSRTCTDYYYAVYKQLIRKSYQMTENDEYELARLNKEISVPIREEIEFVPKKEMTPYEKEFDANLLAIIEAGEKEHFERLKNPPKLKQSIFQKIMNYFKEASK